MHRHLTSDRHEWINEIPILAENARNIAITGINYCLITSLEVLT